MKIFCCPRCRHDLWFDNTRCERCAIDVAYDLATDDFVEVDAPEPACANRATVEACNWIAEVDGWCRSCAADLDHGPTVERRPFQLAKRRTVRQLGLFGIDPAHREPPLRFDLRAGTAEAPVITGHADGLITLDTAEAEAEVRERIRTELGEPYRTPLGHVRHELGHWWWATAVDDRFTTDAFRSRFGDERRSYPEALERHYAVPDDGAWRAEFVSHYASSHPWEDFAESFAHVLHISDTYETAAAHGIVDATPPTDLENLYGRWVELTLTLNELNRSMGTPDAYPFVVSPVAVDKFRFVLRSFVGRPSE